MRDELSAEEIEQALVEPFDPNCVYGNWVAATIHKPSVDEMRMYLQMMFDQFSEFIPHEYHSKITAYINPVQHPLFYDDTVWWLCWKYTPNIKDSAC